jgi:hypothetical protein
MMSFLMQTMCHDVFTLFERIRVRSQPHLVQRESKVRSAVTVLAKRCSEWDSNAVSIDAAKKGAVGILYGAAGGTTIACDLS